MPTILKLLLIMAVAGAILLGAGLRVSAQQPATPSPQPMSQPGSVADQPMTLGHLLSIITGATIGAIVFHVVTNGGTVTIGGVVIGALVGDWWFEEQLWPFGQAPDNGAQAGQLSPTQAIP